MEKTILDNEEHSMQYQTGCLQAQFIEDSIQNNSGSQGVLAPSQTPLVTIDATSYDAGDAEDPVIHATNVMQKVISGSTSYTDTCHSGNECGLDPALLEPEGSTKEVALCDR